MRTLLLLSICLVAFAGCADSNTAKLTRFEIKKDTVLDKNTTLMWARSDNKHNMTYSEAQDYCQSYGGSGFDDWRMPTVSELQGLIDAEVEGKGEILTLSSSMVWASETDDSKAAFCSFKSQRCSWMEQVISISLRALPVRNTVAQEETVTDSIEGDSSFPPSARPQTVEQRLQVLNMLHGQGLITTEEYKQKKSAILDEL